MSAGRPDVHFNRHVEVNECIVVKKTVLGRYDSVVLAEGDESLRSKSCDLLLERILVCKVMVPHCTFLDESLACTLVSYTDFHCDHRIDKD